MVSGGTTITKEGGEVQNVLKTLKRRGHNKEIYGDYNDSTLKIGDWD